MWENCFNPLIFGAGIEYIARDIANSRGFNPLIFGAGIESISHNPQKPEESFNPLIFGAGIEFVKWAGIDTDESF